MFSLPLDITSRLGLANLMALISVSECNKVYKKNAQAYSEGAFSNLRTQKYK